MKASKENARLAADRLTSLPLLQMDLKPRELKNLEFILDFLYAAQRKLPSEASYQKESERKRTKA